MGVLFNETKCFSEVFSFSSKQQLSGYGNILRPFGIFMMEIIAIKCQNVTFMEIAMLETFWYVHLEYFQCVTMQKIYQIRHSMELNNRMNLILIIMIIIMIWWWLLFQLHFHKLHWNLKTEEQYLNFLKRLTKVKKVNTTFMHRFKIYLFRIGMKSKWYKIPLHPHQTGWGEPKWLSDEKKTWISSLWLVNLVKTPFSMVEHLFSSFWNGTTLNKRDDLQNWEPFEHLQTWDCSLLYENMFFFCTVIVVCKVS